MRHATLCFLIKETNGEVSHVLLARKKVRLGAGKYNGAGGRVEPGEDPDTAARREVREEYREVEVRSLAKVAELSFLWPAVGDNAQMVHVYLVRQWEGEPRESDEFFPPEWFPTDALPLHQMMAADTLWLPRVLRGEHLTATFTYDQDGRLVGEPSIQHADPFPVRAATARP